VAKTVFLKVAVREGVKREISVISGVENRAECDIVEDAMKLYKAVVFGKSKKFPDLKKIEEVSLSDVVSRRQTRLAPVTN